MVAEEVCITIKYFPFYFLVIVDGSSLTSSDSFEVRHPVVPSFDYYYYYYVNEQSTQLSVYHLKQHVSTFKKSTQNTCLKHKNGYIIANFNSIEISIYEYNSC